LDTKLNPYLNFRGDARAAMEFYHSIFGGELTLSTFADYHASEDPEVKDKIMHGELVAKGGMTIMGSDTPNSIELTGGNSFSVSLNGDDEAELRRYWDGLSAGATITMPLEKAMWGDTFGMCTDKFGVSWLVNITGAKP